MVSVVGSAATMVASAVANDVGATARAALRVAAMVAVRFAGSPGTAAWVAAASAGMAWAAA